MCASRTRPCSPAARASSTISNLWRGSRMPRSCAARMPTPTSLHIDAERGQATAGRYRRADRKDVAAIAKPIGNLITRKLSYYPCAVGRVRYFGEPVAVVDRRGPLHCRGRARPHRGELSRRDPVCRPGVRGAGGQSRRAARRARHQYRSHAQFSLWRPRTWPFAQPTRSCRQGCLIRASTRRPIETYGVIADYDSRQPAATPSGRTSRGRMRCIRSCATRSACAATSCG